MRNKVTLSCITEGKDTKYGILAYVKAGREAGKLWGWFVTEVIFITASASDY